MVQYEHSRAKMMLVRLSVVNKLDMAILVQYSVARDHKSIDKPEFVFTNHVPPNSPGSDRIHNLPGLERQDKEQQAQ